MREPVSTILANLKDWQQFPKYSLERRVDIWLSAFLAGFIQSRTGGVVELVAAEFPILKRAQGAQARSVNADFLFHRKGGKSLDGRWKGSGWIILELKTDGSSLKASQFVHYFSEINRKSVSPLTGKDLEDGFGPILKSTKPVHRAGYRKLRSRVRTRRDPTSKVEVVCLAPAKIEFPGVHFIGLRELADWKPRDPGFTTLWDLVVPILRAAARSEKGRRTSGRSAALPRGKGRPIRKSPKPGGDAQTRALHPGSKRAGHSHG